MPLFTVADARAAYRAKHPADFEFKSAGTNLFREQLASIDKVGTEHDVFISYSHTDIAVVLGVCYILRDFGFTVYIDRLDRTLSENDVEAAAQLRLRMKFCRSLCYIASENASTSHWTPWELGYFDGLRNTVAILPIADATGAFPPERAYLRLYPYMDRTAATLWVNDRKGKYWTFREWLQTHEAARAAAR